ncbi:hypothetical protein BH23THE1_BH23THE1_28380 [soil metagenome]
MPYVAAIGHRVALADLLARFSFEDIDEAENILTEAGLELFSNDSDDVFITIADQYKIIDKDQYVDLNFSLTNDERTLLKTYTGYSDVRIKLFFINSPEDDVIDANTIFKSVLEQMGTDLNLDDDDED